MTPSRFSLLGRTPGPRFRTRLLTIPPGGSRVYESKEWRDALVVVERGELELCSHAGVHLRLGAGAALALSGLPLSELRNPSTEPLLLSAVTRAMRSDARGGPSADHQPEGEEPPMTQKINVCLWFDTQAEEAARFYCSIFEQSRIVEVSHYTDAGPREAGMVLSVIFELAGQRFMALNGGPQFTFDEAVSLQVGCADQEEIDRYWSRLTDGGSESQCGWLKDRYGLSWQITPADMAQFFTGSPERSRRAMKALLSMSKIDIEAMRTAADGAPA